jgi:hypothetical protein
MHCRYRHWACGEYPMPLHHGIGSSGRTIADRVSLVYSASATFWIEWVRNPGPPPVRLHDGPGNPPPAVMELEPYWDQSTYLQLQYSQLVILIFNGVLWPHVTVATMTLSDG